MSKKKRKKRYSYKRELYEYDIIMGNVALDFDADDDDDDDDDWGGAHPIIPEWMCKFVEGEESDEDDPSNSKLSKNPNNIIQCPKQNRSKYRHKNMS